VEDDVDMEEKKKKKKKERKEGGSLSKIHLLFPDGDHDSSGSQWGGW